MPKMTTQERERHYFEMFRRDYDLNAKCVSYGDKPDVVVKNERTVGIEITNFFLEAGHRPESEQVQRVRRDKVVADAHRAYMSDGGKRFELTFTFDKEHPILDQGRVAKAIVSLAKRVETCGTGELSGRLLDRIPELSSVWLNAKEYDDAKWRIAQVYGVRSMSLSALIDIIKEKEKKADEYSVCDAYWLLVIVDFIDSAQDQEIEVDGVDSVTSEVFEKLFLYKPQFGQIVEMPGKR